MHWWRSVFNEVNDWALGISNHYEYYLIINTVLWNSKMEILFKDALLHILAQNNISKHFKNHEIYRLWDFPKYYIFFLHTHLQYLQFDKKKHLKVHQKDYPIFTDLPHEMLKILFCNLQQILQCLINNIYARLWRDKSNKYLPTSYNTATYFENALIYLNVNSGD